MKREAGEGNCTRLFPTQESVARIVRILQSNKTLNGGVNQVLADCSIKRKRRAPDKIFRYLGYDYLLSHHSSQSEESVRRKAEQVEEAKERLLRRSERNSVLKFGWWRECEDVLCLSLKGNVITSSVTRPEGTGNYSA